MDLIRTTLNEKDISKIKSWMNIDGKVVPSWLKDNIARIVKFGLCEYDVDDFFSCYKNLKSNLSETKTLVYRDPETNQIAGFAVCEFCSKNAGKNETDFLHVHHLVVSPYAQHRGYGSKILLDLMKNSDVLSDFNCKETTLFVHKDNTNCLKLIAKLHFNFKEDYGNLKSFSFNNLELSQEK